ncbi:TPA: hypothetical protein ACFNY7_001333 [Neisseria meningitidis]|uniref:hypothetical protein n=1 Tax=Neisseria meningitidis TaxID=487 RepID=UPI0011782EEF|nr:hypothetical protein [Neisseria meningitidis]
MPSERCSDGIFYTIFTVPHPSQQYRNPEARHSREKQKIKNRNLKSRHSRAGGNLDRSVSAISKNCRSVKFLDSHFRGNDEGVRMAKGRE